MTRVKGHPALKQFSLRCTSKGEKQGLRSNVSSGMIPFG
jgi:hypothetical protein